MALQAIDRKVVKHGMKVAKRNKPVLIVRSNKSLIENVNSAYGPQVVTTNWWMKLNTFM